MQRFLFDDGRTEWWVFRCQAYKCDYEIYEQLPAKYGQLWQHGQKI